MITMHGMVRQMPTARWEDRNGRARSGRFDSEPGKWQALPRARSTRPIGGMAQSTGRQQRKSREQDSHGLSAIPLSRSAAAGVRQAGERRATASDSAAIRLGSMAARFGTVMPWLMQTTRLAWTIRLL